MLLIQYLGQLWQFTQPSKGEGSIKKEEIPNGNEEESREEGSQEEKEVSTVARRGPRLFLSKSWPPRLLFAGAFSHLQVRSALAANGTAVINPASSPLLFLVVVRATSIHPALSVSL